MRCANSAVSRDLPTPGAPSTVMVGAPFAPRRAPRSRRGDRPPGRVPRTASSTGRVRPQPSAATARQARTRRPSPSRSTASTSSYSIALRVRGTSPRRRRYSPRGRAVCRREAVLTTSPATMASPSAGRARERHDRLAGVHGDHGFGARAPGCSALSAATASRTASAARTARSGSSPWAVGAPKTAITASRRTSPRTPPKRLQLRRRTVPWYGVEDGAHVLRVELLGARQ